MAPQNIPYPQNWFPTVCDKKEFEVIEETANYNGTFLVPNEEKWANQNAIREEKWERYYKYSLFIINI